MTGLDCNILVQLALADHPANAATVAAVQAEVQKGNKLVFPSLIVTEFLHVVTDERRFAPPLTMVEALEWIESFLSNPAVSILEPTQASFSKLFSGCDTSSWGVNVFWTLTLPPFCTQMAFTV